MKFSPGTFMKTGSPAPTAMNMASKRSRSSGSVYVLPMIALASIFTPCSTSRLTSAWTMSFGRRNSGMP